jgi:pimeloyl-ACP methyl ester carboxylesterase
VDVHPPGERTAGALEDRRYRKIVDTIPPMRALDAATGLIPALTATSGGVGRHLDTAQRSAFKAPFADRDRTRRFHHLMRSALHSSELFAAVEAAIAGPLATQPMLTIFGERNDPFGFQQQIAARFRDLQSLVVAKGNHSPMCDDPALFATTLAKWHHTSVASRT